MSKINERSVEWLLQHADPKHWAELYFIGKRYGHLTSNIAESLNSWILEAREMPILAMLEKIREQLMIWFNNRRQLEAQTQGLLVSKIAMQLQTMVNTRARRYRYIQAHELLYEIKSKETLREYLVNLENHTCSCREWQSNGYPCVHALAVILGRQENVQLYAKSFYTLDAFRNCYANAIIHPHKDDFSQPLQWNGGASDHDSNESTDESDDPLRPPNTRRQPGRPKKRRIRRSTENEGEPRRIQKCSLCRKIGHSKRTCKEPIN